MKRVQGRIHTFCDISALNRDQRALSSHHAQYIHSDGENRHAEQAFDAWLINSHAFWSRQVLLYRYMQGHHLVHELVMVPCSLQENHTIIMMYICRCFFCSLEKLSNMLSECDKPMELSSINMGEVLEVNFIYNKYNKTLSRSEYNTTDNIACFIYTLLNINYP